MRLATLLLALLLSACTQFPVLDDRLSDAARAADYPDLLPLAPLIAARSIPAERGPEITASLEGRVSALNARASRLRGAVLSPADRARLRERPGS